jgi:hypothetical protein
VRDGTLALMMKEALEGRWRTNKMAPEVFAP